MCIAVHSMLGVRICTYYSVNSLASEYTIGVMNFAKSSRIRCSKIFKGSIFAVCFAHKILYLLHKNLGCKVPKGFIQ